MLSFDIFFLVYRVRKGDMGRFWRMSLIFWAVLYCTKIFCILIKIKNSSVLKIFHCTVSDGGHIMVKNTEIILESIIRDRFSSGLFQDTYLRMPLRHAERRKLRCTNPVNYGGYDTLQNSREVPANAVKK